MKTENVVYRGMIVESVNYKNAQILRNPLTGDWLLLFQNGKNPYVGTLKEMKQIVDEEIKLDFIKPDTYQ